MFQLYFPLRSAQPEEVSAEPRAAPAPCPHHPGAARTPRHPRRLQPRRVSGDAGVHLQLREGADERQEPGEAQGGQVTAHPGVSWTERLEERGGGVFNEQNARQSRINLL